MRSSLLEVLPSHRSENAPTWKTLKYTFFSRVNSAFNSLHNMKRYEALLTTVCRVAVWKTYCTPPARHSHLLPWWKRAEITA